MIIIYYNGKPVRTCAMWRLAALRASKAYACWKDIGGSLSCVDADGAKVVAVIMANGWHGKALPHLA